MVYDPTAARSGAVLSTNPSYRAAWLCYINGIEVPITGFSVTSGVWQIPQFQIFCLPAPDIEDLGAEDRVQVALFYLDQWVDPNHPEWRLLVDGEIIGRSMTHTASGRVQAFTCLSNIHVFQQLFFFFMNTVDDIVAAQSPDNAASAISTPGLYYPYSLFHHGLFAPTNVGQRELGGSHLVNVRGESTDDNDAVEPTDTIKAPYELVYNVIRGLIDKDADPQNTHRSVPMVNFFARHTRKVRLNNRFVRLPLFEDIANLNNRVGVFPIFNAARNDEALAAMQRSMAARVSNSGPVWNVLQQTLATVYMEIGMVTNPACVVTNLDGEIQRILDAGEPIVDQSHSAVPASTAPTPAAVIADNAPVVDLADVLGSAPTPPTVAPAPQPTGLAPASAFQTTPTPTSALGGDTTRPVRLAQYFVKPQFQFGVAPLCNVIFPSMVTSWADDENYVNQPTRIYVNDSVMTRVLRASGANRDFMLHALTVAYPEAADAVLHQHLNESDTGGSYNGLARDTGKDLLIWPEEFFKGPVVARMELPSWFQMLMLARNSPASPETSPASNPTPASTRSQASTTGGALPVSQANTSTTAAPVSAASGTTPAPVTTTATADTAPAPGIALPEVELRGRPRPAATAYAYANAHGQIAMNGTAAGRYFLGYGTGLDPDTYIAPAYTRLWDEHESIPRRMARLARLFKPVLQRYYPALTPEALDAVAFAFAFNSYQEGGASNGMTNWSFGNIRMLRSFPRRAWAVNPRQKLPYLSGTDATNAAENYIEFMIRHFSFAVGVLLGQRPSTARGGSAGGFFSSADALLRRNDEYWARYGGIRPDYFYAALGMLGYYEEGVGDGTPAERGTRRGLNIVTATNGEQAATPQQSFDAMRRASQSIGPDTVVVTPVRNALPLVSPGDLAVLQLHRPATAGAPTTNYASPRADPASAAAATRQTVPGPTPTSPVTTIVTRPATTLQDYTNEGGDTPSRDQSFQRMFRIYAQYEFLRQRYMQRTMNIQVIFNPYVVPGFPCVLFDTPRTNQHRVGHVMAITHTADAGSDGNGSWTTAIQATCVRRFREFLDDIRNDAERFAERVASAPAEIIPEIRRIIQDDGQAELFYQKFLYGGARPYNAPAAFHFQDVIGFADGATTIRISLTGEGVDSAARIREAAARDAATPVPETPPPAPIPPEVTTAAVYRQVYDRVVAQAQTLDPHFNAAPYENTYGRDTGRADTPAAFADALVQTIVAQNQHIAALSDVLGEIRTAYPGSAIDVASRQNAGRNSRLQGESVQPTGAVDPTTGITAASALASRRGVLTVTHNLASAVNLPLQVLPGTPYVEAFDRAETAMQLAARPACTLVQYIRFWHGGRTLGQCIIDRAVEGEELDAAYLAVDESDAIESVAGRAPEVGRTSRHTAAYWRQIYKYRQGPGDPPTDAQQGYVQDPPGPSTTREGLPATYPQTRANWDAILLEYRIRVRTRVSPGV